MSNTESLQLFDDRTIRTAWDEKEEKWYFSVIDIIGTVVETDRPRKYWSDLKKKLTEEGSEVSEKIGRLKMTAPDGKMRMTDVADPEQLCRIPNCPSTRQCWTTEGSDIRKESHLLSLSFRPDIYAISLGENASGEALVTIFKH